VVYMFIIERTPKRHVFLKRLDCYVYILVDSSRFNSQHNWGDIPHHFMTPTLLTVKTIATKREDCRISKIVVILISHSQNSDPRKILILKTKLRIIAYIKNQP
jgi:hypothetical protein